jgi:PadR family transcriptional regulator AphA
MSTQSELTTTSYAILGLLSLRSWTTYELAMQMERTLDRIWPRARSKLYDEPKKLVAHGLAKAAKDRVGKRPRTVYSITPRGRRALAAWLKVPAGETSLQSEPQIKLFFADQGTKTDAVAVIDATEKWAREQLGVFLEAQRSYLAGEGPFPERTATNFPGARFMVDYYEMTLRWAQWARGVVEGWPNDPSRAKPDRKAMADLVRRIEALGISAPDEDRR